MTTLREAAEMALEALEENQKLTQKQSKIEHEIGSEK